MGVNEINEEYYLSNKIWNNTTTAGGSSSRPQTWRSRSANTLAVCKIDCRTSFSLSKSTGSNFYHRFSALVV